MHWYSSSCCCWFAPSQLLSNRPALLRKAAESPGKSQKIAQRSQRSPKRPPRLPGATKVNLPKHRQRPSRTSKDSPKNFIFISARPPAGGFCGRFDDRG